MNYCIKCNKQVGMFEICSCFYTMPVCSICNQNQLSCICDRHSLRACIAENDAKIALLEAQIAANKAPCLDEKQCKALREKHQQEKQDRQRKRNDLVILLNQTHNASSTIQAVMSCYDATFAAVIYDCQRCGYEFTSHNKPKLCASCGSNWTGEGNNDT